MTETTILTPVYKSLIHNQVATIILSLPANVGFMLLLLHCKDEDDVYNLIYKSINTNESETLFKGMPTIFAANQEKPEETWWNWLLYARRNKITHPITLDHNDNFVQLVGASLYIAIQYSITWYTLAAAITAATEEEEDPQARINVMTPFGIVQTNVDSAIDLADQAAIGFKNMCQTIEVLTMKYYKMGGRDN